MVEEEFMRDLMAEIQEQLAEELKVHTAAASRVEEALISYKESIVETVKNNTRARIRRLPDPPSSIEERALELIASVEALPEFQKREVTGQSPKTVATPKEHVVLHAPTPVASAPVPTAQTAANLPPPAGQDSVQEEDDDQDGHPAVYPDKPPPAAPAAPAGNSAETEKKHGKRPMFAVSQTSSPGLTNLAAHSAGRPLHLCAGVPEPHKLQTLANLGIHAAWEPRVVKSVAAIRGGRACAAIFMVGYGSHNQQKEIMDACRDAGIPIWQITKMGNGELLIAAKHLDEMLLKAELEKGK